TIEKVLKVTSGGAHGVLVTAVSPPAFSQALSMVRRKGTVSLVGLPPGNFPTPIFDVVLKSITVRGSIVGTRRDLDEALAFAIEGRVRAEIAKAPLDDVNDIFAALKAGTIEGR
ncbi:zinc-binding dehydrogenase, partial [Rhizobium ruizarguesonis]